VTRDLYQEDCCHGIGCDRFTQEPIIHLIILYIIVIGGLDVPVLVIRVQYLSLGSNGLIVLVQYYTVLYHSCIIIIDMIQRM
jgi:hypothetical protein